VRISECPSHSATFRMSCVAWSMITAQLRRSWCGETVRPARVGQVLAATRTCLSSTYSKPARVIAVPSALTNSSGVRIAPRTLSQARKSRAVSFQRGRQRSLRPFPRTSTLGVRPNVMFSSRTPTSSETRRPPAKERCIIARSRTPNRVVRPGAFKIARISSMVR
jgi:hypothetical protein